MAAWELIALQRSRGFVTAFVVSLVPLVGIGLGPPAIGPLSEYVFSGSIGPSMAEVLSLAGITA
jgi:hypothetical protein